MKKVITIIFLFISILSFSASYDFTIKLLPDEKAVLCSMIVTLENDEKPLFELSPNLLSNKNPYLHPLISNNEKTSIEILSVTDTDNLPMEYSLESRPANIAVRDYNSKNGLLRVKTNMKKFIVNFKTFFTDGNSMDSVAYDDIFIWRFGWFPMVNDLDKNISAMPFSKWRIRAIPSKEWQFISGGEPDKDGSYFSNGYYSSCPITFVRKWYYQPFSISTGKITYTVWSRLGMEHKAAQAAAYVAKAIELHTNRYGDIRYSNINVIQDPYPGLYGMAADGLFLLGDGFFTTSDLMVPGFISPLYFYVISHELAHFWFGIGAGVDFALNNFMSESPTDYSAHISMFENYGNDYAFNFFSPEFMTGLLSGSAGLTLSAMDQESILKEAYYNMKYAPSDNINKIPENFFQDYYYVKGKRAFFTLEDYLGRETLVKILSEYYKKHVGKIVSEEEFYDYLATNPIRKIEREIISNLFENPEIFDSSVTFDRNKSIYRIDLKNRKIPVKVEITTDSTITTFITCESTEIMSNGILHVALDPESHTFDTERHNNYYPIHISYNPLDNVYNNYIVTPVIGISSQNGIARSITGTRFVMYPYWSMGIGSSFYIDAKGLSISYFYLEGIYTPTPWFNFSLMTQSNQTNSWKTDLNIGYKLPQNIDIGSSSPIYDSKFNMVFYGASVDFKNFLGEIDFNSNELYNFGLYSTGGYAVKYENSSFTQAAFIGGTYFPPVSDSIFPHISAKYFYATAALFDPITGERSLIYDNPDKINSSYPDPVLKHLYDMGNVKTITELKGGLSVSINNSYRFNILNLFSLGGINLTIEGVYKYIDQKEHLFGCSFGFTPKIYIITDLKIPISTNINYYYLPSVNNYTITFNLNVSYGMQIFDSNK